MLSWDRFHNHLGEQTRNPDDRRHPSALRHLCRRPSPLFLFGRALLWYTPHHLTPFSCAVLPACHADPVVLRAADENFDDGGVFGPLDGPHLPRSQVARACPPGAGRDPGLQRLLRLGRDGGRERRWAAVRHRGCRGTHGGG